MKQRYSLFIDDSGSRLPDAIGITRQDGMDCFALGGILIKEEDEKTLIEKYSDFCKAWKLSNPLHSAEIRGSRDDFRWLGADENRREIFMTELGELLCDLPVIGFASAVHRPGYNYRYKDLYGQRRWSMCKTAYCTLMDRVTKYVSEQNGLLSVYFEECGKKEDRALIAYTKDLKKIGLPFDQISSEKYNPLSSQQFKDTILGEPHRRKKTHPSIQIADLYLYPMAKAGYDNTYIAYKLLMDRGKIIDATLDSSLLDTKGIKYSCFEILKQKT